MSGDKKRAEKGLSFWVIYGIIAFVKKGSPLAWIEEKLMNA